MINKLKLFTVGLLGVAVAMSANAKTTPAATAALLSEVNVALTAYTQGPSTTVRGVTHNTITSTAINNKAIINALTGQYTAGDLLVYVKPLTNTVVITPTLVTNVTTNTPPTTNVTTTYSTNVVNSELAGYFEVIKGTTVIPFSAGAAATVSEGTSVHGQIIRANGEVASGNDIEIQYFNLVNTNGSWNLALQGLNRSTTVIVSVETSAGATNTVGTGTTEVESSDNNITLTGTGYTGTSTNEVTAVVTGTVSARYYKKQ